MREVNNADLRNRLGELALELGKPRLAAVWFRAALAIDADHARAFAALKALSEESAANTPEPGE
jgi:hypothetical protein